MLRWLLLFALIAILAWWWATPSAPVTAVPAPGAAPALIASNCGPPAQLAGADGAVQTGVPSGMPAFALDGAQAQPLAGFSVAARVLSRERYAHDRESDFAPLDLALGWGRMRDEAVISRLHISQSGRWYRYWWTGDAPLPPDEIVRSSANMHMIPAGPSVAAALDRIDAGDRVRIDGWLVEVDTPQGWRWRSSLTRDDTGNGACEVVYVCAVRKF